MKKLNRIRLINWQGFFDDTIDIEGSTLIIGDNGSGKSSLLDALYYILSGGDAKSFNSAASFKSKRNLETYICGRTGEITRPNLREGPFIVSHICLQFHDDEDKSDFCIGVVLELSNMKQLSKHFYRISGNFPEDMFWDKEENCPLNYASMEKKLKNEHNISIDLHETTSRDFKKKLKSILSLEDEKYYELLPKAMAFQPIDDINEFAYDFLIPEKNIDISRMRDSLNAYNEIRKQIDNDKAKQELLDPIISQGKIYQRDAKSFSLLTCAFHLLSIKTKKEDIRKYEQKNQTDTAKKEFFSKRRDSLAESIERVSQSIYEIKHGEAYQRLMKISEYFKREESNRNEAIKKVNLLDEDIRKEQAIIDFLALNIDLKEAMENRDSVLLFNRLQEEKDLIEEKTNAIHTERAEKEAEWKNIDKELGEVNAELDNLKQGIQSLPPYVDNLIVAIRNIIPEANPIPLCQIIDIKDEEWRNALEGYLGDRRFDLILPINLYPKAASIYEGLKKGGKVHGVGLIDVDRLTEMEISAPGEDSLALKVNCQNRSDEQYINLLLGDISCVETIQDRQGKEKTITKDVYVYENKALRRIDEKSYSVPYIGPESLKIRERQLEQRKTELNKKYEELHRIIQELEASGKKAQESRYQTLLIESNAWSDFEIIDKRYQELKRELDELKKNDNMIPELEQHEKENKELTSQRDVCVSQISKLELAINEFPKIVESLRQQIREEERSLTLAMENGLSNEDLEAFFKESPDINEKTISKKLEKLKDEISALEKDLKRNMSNYIQRFNFDSTNEIESLKDFFIEYNLVVKRNLGKFSMREQETRKEATELFQSDYIQKMRANIKEAQRRVRDLNDVLRKRPFGVSGDIYQFEITKSKEREFGEIYDVFLSNEDYNSSSLFVEELSGEHRRVMEDLLRRLTSQVDESDEDFYKRVNNYLDYRRFMSYDIIIKNSEEKRYRFSEISREKSGGEIQTPFYVIIAASFEQIFNSRYGASSKGCIVLLDEAFEKMDEDHIDSMMQYFTELSIQPFIAVPTQHGRTIMPYVDTSIGLGKMRDRIVTYVLSKES